MKDLLDALEQDYVQRDVKGLREAKNHMKPVHEFFGSAARWR